MKIKIALAAVAMLAASAATANAASFMDVIGFELKPHCTFQKYMAIVSDFNKWGAKYGYKAEIAAPVQNENLTTFYWLGTAKNAAGFGAAWDAWRDAQSNANSGPAKLAARFEECSTNKTREGYDIY